MFVVFDLETTGLSSMTHDVIQFAYIIYDENNMPYKAESLYFYYDTMSWTEEAYAVHQISREFLKQHADKFEENLIKMYAILMHANVCGHNAKNFDCVFATNWLSRMGLPGLTFRCIQDTMTAFRPIVKRPKIKLIKLAEILGVTDEITAKMTKITFGDEIATQAHNAAFDTMRTGIITIMGLKKGYIDFSGGFIAPETYSEEDLIVEENGIGRDPNGLLVRVIGYHDEVTPMYISPSKEFHKGIVTSTEQKELSKSPRCLLGTFTSAGEDVWTLKINRTVLTLKETEPRSDVWSLTIQLTENQPAVDFFNYPNRDAFVKGLNYGMPEWEVINV